MCSTASWHRARPETRAAPGCGVCTNRIESLDADNDRASLGKILLRTPAIDSVPRQRRPPQLLHFVQLQGMRFIFG